MKKKERRRRMMSLYAFRSYLLILCALLVVVLFPTTRGDGQETSQETASESASPETEKKPTGQIMVTGDQLEFDRANNLVTYTGNVKVVQDDTSMFSDTLILHLAKQGSRKLEKAVATGNVRLVNNDITATGEEGIFYNTEQKLELIKNATIWQGNNTITAHRILAYLEQEIIEGYSDKTSERAIMTVYSKGDVIKPFGQTEETDTPAESDAPAQEEASPIVIVSDKLKLDNSSGLGTFIGKVTATQLTTELNADEMKVYLIKTDDGENDVEKIEVFGNVHIVQGTMTITGETGYFQNAEQYAQVEGSAKKKARVEDNAQNLTLEAPIIKLYLDTNKIEAVRPKMIFETGEDVEDVTQESSPTPEQEEKRKVDRNELPSVTLFPAKKK